MLCIIGLCKINETKNLQKGRALPARPPPNKFEGATQYSTNNAKLNNILRTIAIFALDITINSYFG